MTEPKETALALLPDTALSGYVPPPDEAEWGSMVRMANSLAKAQGFLPAHFFGQPYKILAAILYGRDLGISPTNALQHIIVIEGKATADAQLIGMLVRRAGHRLEDATTDTTSTVKITRGDDGSVHEFTFSMQDAQRAGIARAGSAWTKFPKAMLYARALTGCARKAAQDALMGTIYTPEEIGVETDENGAAVLPASTSSVIDGEITIENASPESLAAIRETEAATTPAAPQSPPSQGVSSEGTSSAPPAAEVKNSAQVGQSPAPSRGPRAKRGNVVPAPQGVGDVAKAADTAPANPATMTPSPPVALVDDEEGKAQYLATLRLEVRKLAALVVFLRTKRDNVRNAREIALGNAQIAELPSLLPNAAADVSLGNFIRDQHTKKNVAADTLEGLGEEDLTTVTATLEGIVKAVHDEGIHE